MTSASGIQICTTCRHQALPVNSQVFPALRHVPSPPVVVHVRLPGPAPKNPSDGLGSHPRILHLLGFFFSCEDLLQAKTIKANGLRTFEGAAKLKRL